MNSLLKLYLRTNETNEAIKYLKKQHDINYVEPKCFPALHLAVIYGNVEILKEILSRPELDINKLDYRTDTALHIAAISGNVEVVRMLLSHPNIDLNILNRFNESSLYHAIMRGHLEIVKLLVNDSRILFVGHRIDLQENIYKLLKE